MRPIAVHPTTPRTRCLGCCSAPSAWARLACGPDSMVTGQLSAAMLATTGGASTRTM